MKLTFASAALYLFAASGMAQSVTGRWDGVIKFDEYAIPFPIEFSGQGSQLRGSFFNGDERVTSTAGTIDGNSVVLQFDHYATKLEATLTGGVLKGQYGGKRSG